MPGYEILLAGKEGLVAGLQGERVGTFPPELSIHSQQTFTEFLLCAANTQTLGEYVVNTMNKKNAAPVFWSLHG